VVVATIKLPVDAHFINFFSSAVEILVVAVLQLTGTVNQTGIGIEIETVFPGGENVSTLGPDVGLNLLCVIQHGTKIQVNSISIEECFRLSCIGWAVFLHMFIHPSPAAN
jgi:hypothetical protein